jgi:hypothetical protein
VSLYYEGAPRVRAEGLLALRPQSERLRPLPQDGRCTPSGVPNPRREVTMDLDLLALIRRWAVAW